MSFEETKYSIRNNRSAGNKASSWVGLWVCQKDLKCTDFPSVSSMRSSEVRSRGSCPETIITSQPQPWGEPKGTQPCTFLRGSRIYLVSKSQLFFIKNSFLASFQVLLFRFHVEFRWTGKSQCCQTSRSPSWAHSLLCGLLVYDWCLTSHDAHRILLQVSRIKLATCGACAVGRSAYEQGDKPGTDQRTASDTLKSQPENEREVIPVQRKPAQETFNLKPAVSRSEK